MSTRELEAAIAAARAAGQVIRDHIYQRHHIEHKGPADLITEVDRLAEERIVEILHAAFPGYGLLCEEGHASDSNGGPRWVVDPLDGTTNYAHGYPHFGTSIALEVGGESLLGVVYQPLADELFVAEKGKGAQLNGRPVRVSATDRLDLALIGSGFPYDVWTNPDDNTAEWRRFTKRVISVRCDGAAALDLCFVAAGRLDGFWELDLGPWDMAAGALICAEAGGRVSLMDGGAFTPFQRGVLASNGRLHAEMLRLLERKHG